MKEIIIGEHKFCFAVPCYDGSISVETSQSLIDTTSRLTQSNVRWNVLFNKGNAIIELSRNELAHRFLTETDADVLVWIDNDVGWDWNGMSRLLAWSTLYPASAGVYCARVDPPKFNLNTYGHLKGNEYGLIPIKGIGFGFMAIQRKVLEELVVPTFYKKETNAPMKQFFKNDVTPDGKFYGEDMYFCHIMKEQLGHDVMIDPEIALSHHGNKDYTYLFKDFLPKLREKHNGI